MCLYGLPRSRDTTERITYPAADDDRDATEAEEVHPTDPPPQPADVVAKAAS